MAKFIGTLCILGSLVLIAFMSPTVQFYKKDRTQRLYNLWQSDLQQLEAKPEFKKMLLNIGKIEFNFTDPQVADELDKLTPPFKKTDGASLSMKIDVIRWIDKNRYGYILQHEIFDSNDNKLYEFGRTYKVGIIW